MAKRFTFLLVVMFVLLLATVTAFAGNTESTTPAASFTKDKADLLEVDFKVSVKDLENNYSDIFFDGDSTSHKNIITVRYEREYSVENELRHTFTGSVLDSSNDDNPVIMLMYIKVDGKYVPLHDVDTGKNLTEKPVIINSKVDLKYLGSDEVNEVRIIGFRKNDAGKLSLNNNLQITDLKITVTPWNLIEKLKITYNKVVNDLNLLH